MQEILSMLIEGTDLLLEWMENPHAQRRRIYGILTHEEWERLFHDQRRKAALKRMREKKWLEDKQTGNVVTFELSKDAIVEHLKVAIQNKKPLPTYQMTLVSFDFPEVTRKARLTWRRLLKKLGFNRIQLSVWSHTKDIAQEIRYLTSALNIDKWVMIFRAESID